MRIILLGAPGAGKGTQSSALSDHLGILKIATGDMLRAAVDQGSDFGKQAKYFMDQGNLVPDKLMVALVKERVTQQDCRYGFVLDGFPRTLVQAEALIDFGVHVQCVLYLNVPQNEIILRLSGRRLHPASGRIYHLVNKPPQVPGRDDVTGDPLIQRDDDKEETTKKRLAVYEESILPLIAFYRDQDVAGRLKYAEVSGQGEEKQITKSLLQAVDSCTVSTSRFIDPTLRRQVAMVTRKKTKSSVRRSATRRKVVAKKVQKKLTAPTQKLATVQAKVRQANQDVRKLDSQVKVVARAVKKESAQLKKASKTKTKAGRASVRKIKLSLSKSKSASTRLRARLAISRKSLAKLKRYESLQARFVATDKSVVQKEAAAKKAMQIALDKAVARFKVKHAGVLSRKLVAKIKAVQSAAEKRKKKIQKNFDKAEAKLARKIAKKSVRKTAKRKTAGKAVRRKVV